MNVKITSRPVMAGLAAGVTAVAVVGAALVVAPAASAAGEALTVNPASGNANTLLSATTNGGCPSNSDAFRVEIAGGDIPADTNVNGYAPLSSIGASGGGTTPLNVQLSSTLDMIRADNGLASLATGVYTITLRCLLDNPLEPDPVLDYAGQIRITSAMTATSPGAYERVEVVTPTTTTITSATPAAGATNAPATFTAAVTPSGATGTVQFTVDGNPLGSPVAVSGGTVTSPSTGLLSAGAHPVVANFTGGSGFGNSASAPFTYNVEDARPPSDTNLSLSASSVAYPAPVTATATVTSGSSPVSAGTVQFKVDGVNAGSAVAVDGSGVAVSAPIVKTAGNHTVVAVYSGSSTVATSTSPSATFEVTAAGPGVDEQNIETSIDPGTLVLSTPYTPSSPLVLPAMTLNTTATEYRTAAVFEHIRVTDTRPGNSPWTVSAISSDLHKDGVASPSGNETIDAQNVGLTNLVLLNTNVSPNTVGTASAGSPALGLPTNLTLFSNPAAAHVAAGSGGSLGLGGSPKPIIHANQGLGTTETAGDLTITAPTNTLEGTYKGVITFTILGS